MTISLTKRFKMSLTLSNKENRKIDGVTPCMVEYMETNFVLTKPRHSKLILPVPSIIQFIQIQTSFSLLFRLFLLEAKEVRDFFLSSVIRKTSLDSHLFIESFIQKNNRLSFTTQQGKVFFCKFIPYNYLIRLSLKILIFFITWLPLRN